MISAALCTLAACLTAGELSTTPGDPRAHTYSIICYDTVSQQFGAAVQSHWFRVYDVIWAKPRVGVVASQSLADFTYGQVGLEMMAAGRTAEQTLAGLIASDNNSAVRQVAMIDATAGVAAHTGEKCIAAAGHIVDTVDGIVVSCQANLMRLPGVPEAMLTRFANTDGDLAQRMMSALEAAEEAGGDIRGKQSAALFVTRAEATGRTWEDRIHDVRVDDSAEPLPELRRLLDVSRSYQLTFDGYLLLQEKKLAEANALFEEAIRLNPDQHELIFWWASDIVRTGAGESSDYLPIFKRAFEMWPEWKDVVPRLVESGLLPDDSALITEILAQ